MAAWHYDLLSFLPAVPDLGEPAFVGLGELLGLLDKSGGTREGVELVALEDDLRTRQSFISGEESNPEFLILSREQGAGEVPLPDFLELEGVGESLLEGDRVWEAFYAYGARRAKSLGSDFLAEWIDFEVSLKNAFVSARAESTGTDPQRHYVMRELGSLEGEFTGLLRDWAEAESPRTAFLVIERARWDWLAEHDAWFSFGDDELFSYAAKLVVSERWNRVKEADGRELFSRVFAEH